MAATTGLRASGHQKTYSSTRASLSAIEEDFAKLGALLKELRQQPASAESTPQVAAPTAAPPEALPGPVAAIPESVPEEPARGQQLSMF